MKLKIVALLVILFPCCLFAQKKSHKDLPKPFATKSVTNYSNVTGWKDGETPKAPEGFVVTRYADGFDNPRWTYVAPNGDLLVAETNSKYSPLKQVGAVVIGAAKSKEVSKSADRIVLLRDSNKDGMPEKGKTFLTAADGLNQPFGMLVIGNWFYVANTDALLRYPFDREQTKIMGPAVKIVDLPAGKNNQHWTRNLIANADESKIYIAVGSGTNIAEKGLENEVLRADILEINPDGSGLRVYASGLRNPVGLGFAPGTKTLWAAVNERDELGNDLVPDYLTSVQDNGFYGWPYAYWGNHIDPRVKTKQPEQIKKTIVPEVDLGAHTASLGLAFYTQKSFPEKYRNGAFIAQHGSWNRDPLSGYKVVFVPFKNGKPSGQPEDFLTGFVVDPKKNEVRGRPVGVTMLPDGAMLVTDDTSNVIWKVSASK